MSSLSMLNENGVYLGPEVRPTNTPPRDMFGSEMQSWLRRQAEVENPSYGDPYSLSIGRKIAEWVNTLLLEIYASWEEIEEIYRKYPELRDQGLHD